MNAAASAENPIVQNLIYGNMGDVLGKESEKDGPNDDSPPSDWEREDADGAASCVENTDTNDKSLIQVSNTRNVKIPN